MILAIDTSTESFSIAISEGSRVLGEIYFDIGMKHSTLIHKYIQNLLDETKIELSRIDLFACSIGPGSFTGIRIGLCCAKTLAQLYARKLVGVSTLDILSEGILMNLKEENIIICPVIKGSINEIYISFYNCYGSRLTSYVSIGKNELVLKTKNILKKKNVNKIIFTGNCECISENEFRNLGVEYCFVPSVPKASILSVIANNRDKNKYSDVKPFYITEPRIR